MRSGQWRGRIRRPWHDEPRRPAGLTGAKLDAWIDRMASRYPANVRTN